MAKALQLLRDEIERDMALLGCRSVAEISRKHGAEGLPEGVPADRTVMVYFALKHIGEFNYNASVLDSTANEG